MTFNKLPSIFNQLRPFSVGFDNLFNHFESMLDGDEYFCTNHEHFPFYNLVKTGDSTYDIELALAGYDKKDGVIHKGIAKRYFSKSFTIADDVKIEDAELKDGLLKVFLMKIVPEGKKPKKITVK